MELHLINGFLGSGKTTAIISATKSLIQQGKTVGIVTNDKGRFQVDTAFFQSQHIPTRQVTGGCFRCSFSEFEEKIAQLKESTPLDIIFAESVGSCVDLVNTIFSPIEKNLHLDVQKTTYSVFTDIRLFDPWIHQEQLPFSDQINYLFDKQIEESKLLILNKADLLMSDECKEILDLALVKFPEKDIILQNSLETPGVLRWLRALEREGTSLKRPGFVVDYPQYKAGEKEMAWLDHVFTFESTSPEKIRPALIDTVDLLLAHLQEANGFVGHIKLLISCPEKETKISFTTADFLAKPFPPHWKAMVPEITVQSLPVMLNARLSMAAGDFAEIVQQTVDQASRTPQIHIRSEAGSSYNPEMAMSRPS